MTGLDDWLNTNPAEDATTEGAGSPLADWYSGMAESNKLRLSVETAKDTPPEQAARVLKLQMRTGLPEDLIERNIDTIEREATRQDFDAEKFRKESPLLADWMAQHPTQAAFALGDQQPLTRMERALQATADVGRATVAAVPQTVGMNLSGTAEMYRSAARSMGDVVTQGLSAVGLDGVAEFLNKPMVPWWLSPTGILDRPGEELKTAGKGIAPPPERQNLATDIAGGVGQLATQIATAIVAPYASTPSLLAQGADQMADRAAEAGATDQQADLAVWVGAGVTGLTEKYGLDLILNRVPPAIKNKVMRQLADVSIAGGVEAAQEVTEGILQNLAEYAIYNPDAQILEGLEREALAAGGSAVIVRSIINMALPGRQVYRSRESHARINELTAAAQELKHAGTAPEVYARLVQHLNQSGTAVRVPADKFAEYFQSQGQDPAAAAARITGDPRAWVEASATGHDLAIPADRWVTEVAPTDAAAALAKVARLSEDEMTPEEADYFEENREQVLSDFMAQMGEQGMPADDPSTAVYTDALGQLLGTGMERGAAERQAKLTQAAFGTLAQRAGLDPRELWAQYNPTIQRPLPEALRARSTVDTNWDPLIDALRKGEIPSQTDAFGVSLLDLLRERGLRDEGGELAARDVDKGLKPFQRRLSREGGMSLDEAARLAWESGYLPEARDTNEYTPDQLLAAIDDELRGAPRFAQGQENRAMMERREILQQLDEYLGRLGVDMNTASNEEVKRLLSGEQDQIGVEFAQINPAWTPPQRLAEALERVGMQVNERASTRSGSKYVEAIHPESGELIGVRFADHPITGAAITLHGVPDVEIGEHEHADYASMPDALPRIAEKLGLSDEQLQTMRRLLGGEAAEGAEYTHPLEPESEEFRKWFGNSQVVDESGSPLAVYHGTSFEFSEFSNEFGGTTYGYDQPGFFFTTDIENARAVADDSASASGDNPKILKAYVSLQSPLLVEIDNEYATNYWDSHWERLSDRAERGDHDGIIIKSRAHVFNGVGINAETLVIAFNSDHIRIVNPNPSQRSQAEGAEYGQGVTLPAGTVVWHGTMGDFSLSDGLLYLSSDPTEAMAYARGAIPGTSRGKSGDANLVGMQLSRDARVMDVGADVAAALENDDDIDSVISSLADKARGEGYGFLSFYHPGVESDEFRVLVSINPRDDLVAMDSPFNVQQAADGRFEVMGPDGGMGLFDTADDAAAARGDYEHGYFRVRGRTFYQGDTDKRGSIQISPNRQITINLFEKANLSTFLHESGHFYFEVLADLAERADAPQQIRDDYAALLAYVGVGSRTEVTVEHHERIARSFEAYLMEGTAPSVELQGVFARMRAWFQAIYRALRNLNVDLSDEVRQVFDRMLATDEEIQAAHEAQNYVDLDAQALGMDEAEHAAYRDAVARSREEAASEVGTQLQRAWQREELAWWRERKDEVRAQVAAEVDVLKDQIARAVLAKGTLPDGSPLPEGFQSVKLSKAVLVDMYGEAYLARLPRPYVYRKEGGVHPDQAAEMLGYSSGDALVEALINSKARGVLIAAETEARMRDLYPDPLTDGTLAERAMHAVHNDRRGDVLVRELRALERRAGRTTPTSRQIARAAAERIIGQKKVRDINPHQYRLAEAKAARRTVEAILAGHPDQAAHFKRQQILNHEAYRVAVAARERSDKIENHMRRLQKKSRWAAIGKVGGDYQDQLAAILEDYEFRRVTNKEIRRRESLRDFLKRMEDEGRTHAVSPEAIERAGRVNYRELPFEQLQGVYDTVRAIEHLADTKKRLLLAKEERDMDVVVEELTGAVYDNAAPVKTDRAEVTENLKRFGNDIKGTMLNVDTMTRELDGWADMGAAYSHLKAPIDQATAETLLPMQEQSADAMLDIYKRHFSVKELKALGNRVHIREIGGSITREQMLALAWNWGNTSNREAVLASRNLFWLGSGVPTQEQIDAVLARLSSRDWAFVQDVWDYNESYWDRVSATHKRRTGLPLTKIEHLPFSIKTSNGETISLRGGYMTLKYDSAKSARAAEISDNAFEDLRTGKYGKAHTPDGFMQERVGSGGMPVRLDFGVWHRHIQEAVYNLALGDAVNYVSRVLGDSRVRRAFTDTDNLHVLRALDLWLKDTATGEIVAGGMTLQGVARHLRVGFTVSKLAWNIGTAAVQFTGIASTGVVLGPKYTAAGVRQFMSGKWRGESSIANQIYAESAFMRKRADTFSKDIGEIKRMQRLAFIPERLRPTLFYMMTKTQAMVDFITYLGARAKGMEQFKDTTKAVQYAERMVARAQGSGIWSDRAAVERGTVDGRTTQSEFVRGFTVLGGYMLNKANLAYEHTKRTDFKNPKQVMTWTTQMVLLFIVEALLYEAVKGGWPGDDEDDDGLAWWMLKQGIKTAAGTLPIAREFAGEVQGFHGGGVFGSVEKEFGDAWTQTEQGEIDMAMVKAINDVGGILLHYPSGQINTVLDAAARNADGEEVSPIEYLIRQRRD